MACAHRTLTFKNGFVERHNHRLFDMRGHCAECGAPMMFEPQPTLSLDSRNLQIPFRMGAPDARNLAPQQLAPVLIGGERKVLN